MPTPKEATLSNIGNTFLCACTKKIYLDHAILVSVWNKMAPHVTSSVILILCISPILTASVIKSGNNILKDFLLHPDMGKCDVVLLEDGTRGPPPYGVSLQEINR